MESNIEKNNNVDYFTKEELYDYAEKAIAWIDPNDENDPEGRYWLACYQGCGEYRLIVKDKKIAGAIYGNFHDSRPCTIGIDGKKKVVRHTKDWSYAIRRCAEDRIGKCHLFSAFGSGTRFFLQDKKNYEKYVNVREYDVPSAQGGYHHNIEII